MRAGPKAGWITLCIFQSSCIGFFPCCRTTSSDALCGTAGRSSSRWQQVSNAEDIEPHPGPPRKRPAPSRDLLQADILSPSAARYVSTLFEFEQFLAVCDIKSVRQLASRADLEACCPRPWLLEQARPHARILAGIIHRIPSPLNISTLDFSSGPATWNYHGSSRPRQRASRSRVSPE